MDDKVMARKDSEPLLAWLLFGLLALLLLWLFYGMAAYFVLPLVLAYLDVDTQKLGQFGDVFGALNALFSAFAFAVLIFTMFLQRRELALQREELEHTRNEIRGQKEQLEAQNHTMQRQVFEGSFFALLEAYQDIVRMLETTSGGNDIRGRNCFLIFYVKLRSDYKKVSQQGLAVLNDSPEFLGRVRRPSEDVEFQKLIKDRGGLEINIAYSYVMFFLQYQANVGHYFRTVYHIFRFIDESDLPWEDKQRFARIVRAQLSTFELLLFFYNGLSPYGYKKFWPLANKYEIFQNLDVDQMFDPSHAKYYDGALGREVE